VHLVGYLKKKSITMRGNMKVKYDLTHFVKPKTCFNLTGFWWMWHVYYEFHMQHQMYSVIRTVEVTGLQ